MSADAPPPVLVDLDARGVAHLTLNRPEVGNAYDAAMLAALIDGLARLAGDARVRAVVLRGAGRHFLAGADVHWLGRAAEYAPEQAFEASFATTRAMQMLNEFPRPTVAVVHGACFGGGCGLVCCADVALATPAATFGLTEVRVGVAPTPISTHMVHAMGLRHTRRYALTGERFGAAEACRIGLVHEVVAAEGVERRVEEILEAIFLGAPGAIAVTKSSFLAANGLTLDSREMAMLAHESWTQRSSGEGKEGTRAFREKRPPAWYVPPLPREG
jgi:methylglutaconyl-CoA hydratase